MQNGLNFFFFFFPFWKYAIPVQNGSSSSSSSSSSLLCTPGGGDDDGVRLAPNGASPFSPKPRGHTHIYCIYTMVYAYLAPPTLHPLRSSLFCKPTTTTTTTARLTLAYTLYTLGASYIKTLSGIISGRPVLSTLVIIESTGQQKKKKSARYVLSAQSPLSEERIDLFFLLKFNFLKVKYKKKRQRQIRTGYCALRLREKCGGRSRRRCRGRYWFMSANVCFPCDGRGGKQLGVAGHASDLHSTFSFTFTRAPHLPFSLDSIALFLPPFPKYCNIKKRKKKYFLFNHHHQLL